LELQLAATKVRAADDARTASTTRAQTINEIKDDLQRVSDVRDELVRF
jgi:hypothetical protein